MERLRALLLGCAVISVIGTASENQYQTVMMGGMKLAQAGRLHEAMAAFESATPLRPREAAPYQNIGIIAMQLGDAARGVKAFEAALKLNPSESGVLNGLGQAQNKNSNCSPFIFIEIIYIN